MKRASLLLAVLFILIPVSAAYSAVAKVTLRAESQVKPVSIVRIGDIADVTGPKGLVSRISDVAIATAPLAGQRKTVDLGYIRLRLNALDLSKDVALSGPKTAALVGKCRNLTSQELGEQAKSFLTSQLPQDNRTYEVTVERAPRNLIVPESADVQIKPRLLNPNLRPGVNSVAIEVVVDGKSVATTSAALQVKAVADVLVATGAIRQGDALTTQNTAWEPRDVTQAPSAIAMAANGENPNWVARRTDPSGHGDHGFRCDHASHHS